MFDVPHLRPSVARFGALPFRGSSWRSSRRPSPRFPTRPSGPTVGDGTRRREGFGQPCDAALARPFGAGRDRTRGHDGPQGATSHRERPIRVRQPQGAAQGCCPALSARRRLSARGVLDPAGQRDRPGIRGGGRPGRGRGAAVRDASRGGPAAHHARRVRRVRGGGPAIAGLPRGDEEAGHRGPQTGHDRRLVGRPLRQ